MGFVWFLTGNCSAGWYCNHTSSTKYQHVCPAGSYCPSGSDIPTPCPAGTYSGLDNNGAVSDCLNCTAGHYCHGNSQHLFSLNTLVMSSAEQVPTSTCILAKCWCRFLSLNRQVLTGIVTANGHCWKKKGILRGHCIFEYDINDSFVCKVLETLPQLPSVLLATTAPGDRNQAPPQDWSALLVITVHWVPIIPSSVPTEPINQIQAKMAAWLVPPDISVMQPLVILTYFLYEMYGLMGDWGSEWRLNTCYMLSI